MNLTGLPHLATLIPGKIRFSTRFYPTDRCAAAREGRNQTDDQPNHSRMRIAFVATIGAFKSGAAPALERLRSNARECDQARSALILTGGVRVQADLARKDAELNHPQMPITRI